MPRKITRPPLRNDYWPFATRPTPCACDACARPTRKSEDSAKTVPKRTRPSLPLR